jgi:hypothetical protein
MDPLDVTVVSCLYGGSHDDFLPDWLASVKALGPAPREVLVATDRYRHLTDGCIEVFTRRHGWKYPQAFHLNEVVREVQTEWFWILDIDDLAFPDALGGINFDQSADVIQMGYLRSDGEEHLPSHVDIIELDERNGLVAGSIVRTQAVNRIGGFRDVAFQDWDLWRRLYESGSFFVTADRPRFHYRRHHATRGARELTAEHREAHVAEMV